MTFELFYALVMFAFVSTVTPGPNNMMLMASGLNFGVWRTVPHLAGILVGCFLQMSLMGIGLAKVFEAYPALHTALKVVSAAYLMWLAWKIANAAPRMDDPKSGGKPFTFLQAALFQWVNPKAWSMSLTALTVYMPEGMGLIGPILIAFIFETVALPSIVAWAVLGARMRGFLNTPTRLRTFNITMAVLLVLSLWPILR